MSIVHKAQVSGPSVLTSAARWIRAEGISTQGLEIHVYRGVGRHPRAAVVVGTGRRNSGTRIGFVAEVLAEKGVLRAVMMDADITAQSHALAASIAGETGQALIDVMEQAVAQLRSLSTRGSGSYRGRATSTQF